MYQLNVIYGDRHSPFQAPVYTGDLQQEITTAAHLARAAVSLGFSEVILLNQIHSTTGHLITKTTDITMFQRRQQVGDFLICTVPNIAIGIATADCMPLMLVDAHHTVVAALHVGWKGLATGIISAALAMLQEQCDTTPEELIAALGPCAQACCYEVGASFRKELPYTLQDSSLYRTTGQQTFFDLPAATIRTLVQEGIAPDQIITSQNCCTICSPHYYSHRRTPAEQRRQISIIGLL